MQVLVTGGDGFVGRYLCAELSDRGHDVTSFSRSPDPTVLPDGVSTVAGDITNPADVESALEGIEAVINLVAVTPLFTPKGGNEMHEKVHLGGTKNVVEAAEKQGVERLVQMSANGADPNGKTHYIRAKGRAEELVKSSDLDWVIFRPSIIFGDGDEFVGFTKKLKKWFAPGVPLYPLPGGGDQMRFQPIWVEDFVPMMAEAVEEDEHVGQTYEVGGPEIYTLREVTEMVYDSEGKSIKIVPLPMALAGIGLKSLSVVPGFPMGADQYRSLTFDNTTGTDALDAFDVDPDSLETFQSYLKSR